MAMHYTMEKIRHLEDAANDVCMDCPRPPAWDGGEEECERCMVRKLCEILDADYRWHMAHKED